MSTSRPDLTYTQQMQEYARKFEENNLANNRKLLERIQENIQKEHALLEQNQLAFQQLQAEKSALVHEHLNLCSAVDEAIRFFETLRQNNQIIDQNYANSLLQSLNIAIFQGDLAQQQLLDPATTINSLMNHRNTLVIAHNDNSRLREIDYTLQKLDTEITVSSQSIQSLEKEEQITQDEIMAIELQEDFDHEAIALQAQEESDRELALKLQEESDREYALGLQNQFDQEDDQDHSLAAKLQVQELVEDAVIPEDLNKATLEDEDKGLAADIYRQGLADLQRPRLTPSAQQKKSAEEDEAEYLNDFSMSIYVQTYSLQLALIGNTLVLRLAQQAMLINVVGTKDSLTLSIQTAMSDRIGVMTYQQFGFFGNNKAAERQIAEQARQGVTFDEQAQRPQGMSKAKY